MALPICLWYDGNAEEAVAFYCSVFKKSKKGKVVRFNGTVPNGLKPGSVLTIEFTLNGQPFLALNGGPAVNYTQAVSLIVYCKTQKEVDDYWKKLTAGGGKEIQCGWLVDKYGLSWQITPEILPKTLAGKNEGAKSRIMAAMMPMVKLDVAALRKAAAG